MDDVICVNCDPSVNVHGGHKIKQEIKRKEKTYKTSLISQQT